jgi:hypothetical protein
MISGAIVLSFFRFMLFRFLFGVLASSYYLLLRLPKFDLIIFMHIDTVLDPKIISLEHSPYLTRIGLHQDCHVNGEVKAYQGYAQAAKLVSSLRIGNEICETHDRVHDQCNHRFVEQLHSSLGN